MRVLLLIPSVLKTNLTQAVEGKRHPQMDYWALKESLEREFGSESTEILDYAAVEQAKQPLVQWVLKTAGKDVALAMMGFLRAPKVDAIFTNGENIGIPLALLLRLRVHRPGHVTIGHRLSTGKKRLFFQVLKVQREIDTIFLYAKTQLDFSHKILGIEPEKLKLIAFHADTDFYRADNSTVSVDNSSATEDLISAAGLEWRDYPTLIHAVKDMEGVTVNLAAASPWSKHVNETEKFELPSNVTARRYAYDELRDLYNRSMIVTVPLYENDFQAGVTTLLEAMAMGKPVIVTQTTGQTDVIQAEENGLTVPPGDIEAWKQAISRLRKDATLRKRLGNNARTWVERNATLTLWVDNIVGALKDSLPKTVR